MTSFRSGSFRCAGTSRIRPARLSTRSEVDNNTVVSVNEWIEQENVNVINVETVVEGALRKGRSPRHARVEEFSHETS